jgi:outer membrane lipoprotein carrier protein
MKATVPLLVIALICAFAPQVRAAKTTADAYARLDSLTSQLQSFTADFKQTVRDAQGRKVEESSGTLALRKPNRFRWDYSQPHAQVIVADGSKLWLYDPDLEQVTVRKLDQSLAGTPALLLSGEGDLRDAFRVERSERRSDVDWLTLVPKQTDTDFKSVRLALRDDTLVGMELADKLGQTTTLEFSHVQRNPAIDIERFTFKPPAGVDVIGDADDKLVR